MKFSKKIISFCSACFITLTLFSVEFSTRLMPDYVLAPGSMYNYLFGGSLSLDVNLFSVRKRDDIYISVQGSPTYVITRGIVPFWLYDFGLAAGYNFRINDRFSIGGEGLFGVWNLPENKDLRISSAAGLFYGGRLQGAYHFRPDLSVFAFTSYKNYSYQPESFMNRIEIGLGLSYNFTKGLFGQSDIKNSSSEYEAIFPIFYSRYDQNPFGKVTFLNNEKNAITDVEVSVFIEQFMSTPKVVASYDKVGFGQEFEVNLTAFLNESILNQLQNQLSTLEVKVTYRSLGKASEYKENVSLQTFTRNSMSWEDDRRAAAFISARDGAVQRFARQIQLALKNRVGENPNNQYASAVFTVLKAYGINYVVDPSSAFTDNVGTASIDFLQFPYQTLLYHGGDCDDLTILNCSLLEALGVKTAIITIPGHIFMAYDSGYTISEADNKLGRRNYISQDNKAWVPVEITVSQDTYSLALQLGMKQWNKYPEERLLIPVEEAWKEYKPVSLPDSDISLAFPKDALK